MTLAPRTIAARGHAPEHEPYGAAVPSLVPATTYLRGEDYALVTPGREYARDDNPTLHAPEAALAALEGGDALVFASGMAAATTLLGTALNRGDVLVFPRYCYQGLRRWVNTELPRRGIEVREIDTSDLAQVDAALAASPAPAMVWLETPANPTWQVCDIAAIAARAKKAGARTCVDCTVATPVHTQALARGADVVFHSATKYLNGHSDVLAGALVFDAAQSELLARVRLARAQLGTALGPFEAWLLQRGLRTLFVRVERQSATAAALAAKLAADARVIEVLYPGLPTFAGHDVARAQMRGGFGGMLSVRVAGGREGALAVASRMRVFLRATSLGGTESLVEHRATVEGEGSRAPADLLRLSIGLEDEADLWRDLRSSLT